MKKQITIIAIVCLFHASSSAWACSACGCTPETAAACSQDAKVVDIVHTAEHAGQFKTLLAALGAADLTEALQGPGPFTVFAPTDKAFAALPAGTVESLLQPKNKAKLQSILKYHVLAGNLSSHDILTVHTVKTLNGQAIYPSVLVDNAAIQMKNIYCRNGVIHVIDHVILPQEKS